MNPYCILPPGIAERAVLSEASLQALLVLYQDNPNDGVIKTALSDMCQSYVNYALQVDDIATAFAPWMVDSAIDITEVNFLGPSLPRGLFKRHKRSDGMASYQRNTNGREGAFVEGLIGGTIPGPCTKHPCFVNELISRAVIIKHQHPLISKVSGEAIATIRPYLLQSPTRTNCSVGPAARFASGLLFQRALIADTALSALMKLSRSQLDQLKMKCAGRPTVLQPQEGRIFDFIRSTIEKIGPSVLRIAHGALQRVDASLGFAGAEKRRLELKGTSLVNVTHSTRHSQPRVTYVTDLDEPAPDFYRIADAFLNRK
ncbi:hypothetical protein ONZ45_g1420 [Pleurotus djamor]|nr:hypothetical protein ONZ45_g1420 [Pleurotus djamor]